MKLKELKKGCGKLFSHKQGWVGRPYKYPCREGDLCPECKKKLK